MAATKKGMAPRTSAPRNKKAPAHRKPSPNKPKPRKQWTAGRPQLEPDTQWFQSKLQLLRMSAARMAPRIHMHPSGFHHLIHGRRRATAAEVDALAVEFGVPREEMLARLGAAEVDRNAAVSVPIIGTIGPKGAVTMFAGAKRERVPAPPGTVAGSGALRVDAPGPAAHWVMYCGGEPEPAELVGRLAMVTYLGALNEIQLEHTVVGTVTRGRTARTYSILEWDSPDGKRIADNVRVKSAALVAWIKTA